MVRQICKLKKFMSSHKFQDVYLHIHVCFKSCTLVPDNGP